MLRNYGNLRKLFNPENWLADKNQLFSCLLAKGTSSDHLEKKIHCMLKIVSSNLVD